MYKSHFSGCIPKPTISVPRAVDTFESAGFELNSYGHIRNDFSQLAEEQSILDYQRLLSRMQEVGNVEGNKDASFDELVSKLKPRWVQTPAELDRFEQYLINNELEYWKSLQEKDTSGAATMEFDNDNVGNIETKAS